MKKNLNEHGYALLLVMMLVLLFTTLGMGLLAMNINASKQFNLKEEQVQARHQAEMGVLHYQKELEKYIAANNPTIDNAASFCNNISPLTVTTNSTDKKYTTTLQKNNCTLIDGKLTIPLESVGAAGQKGNESVEAKLYLTRPNVVPPIPTVPPGAPIITKADKCLADKQKGQDCNMIFNDFTDFSGTTEMLVLKKGKLEFKDHLILNSLDIEGGNGEEITVAKDLYIKKLLNVQNHACIAVQGNLSILESIASKNKLYIYVYGDANLPSIIDLNSPNNEIFVNGDVYINGIKQSPKPSTIKTFPTTMNLNQNGCTLPGASITSTKKWSLLDKVDAVYK